MSTTRVAFVAKCLVSDVPLIPTVNTSLQFHVLKIDHDSGGLDRHSTKPRHKNLVGTEKYVLRLSLFCTILSMSRGKNSVAENQEGRGHRTPKGWVWWRWLGCDFWHSDQTLIRPTLKEYKIWCSWIFWWIGWWKLCCPLQLICISTQLHFS